MLNFKLRNSFQTFIGITYDFNIDYRTFLIRHFIKYNSIDFLQSSGKRFQIDAL